MEEKNCHFLVKIFNIQTTAYIRIDEYKNWLLHCIKGAYVLSLSNNWIKTNKVEATTARRMNRETRRRRKKNIQIKCKFIQILFGVNVISSPIYSNGVTTLQFQFSAWNVEMKIDDANMLNTSELCIVSNWHTINSFLPDGDAKVLLREKKKMFIKITNMLDFNFWIPQNGNEKYSSRFFFRR